MTQTSNPTFRVRTHFVLVLLLPLAFAIGCGASGAPGSSGDVSANIDQLNTGDSQERVVELLGTPDRKSDSPHGKEWHYESTVTDQNGSAAKLKVRVVIKNGTVVAVSRSRSPLR